jgi:hypothetical protein
VKQILGLLDLVIRTLSIDSFCSLNSMFRAHLSIQVVGPAVQPPESIIESHHWHTTQPHSSLAW